MAAAGRSRRVNFRISLALTAELRNILILPVLSEEFRFDGKKVRKTKVTLMKIVEMLIQENK